MIHDPELIYYACIAKGSMVLAEFISKDDGISEIAGKCLEKTPPFHAVYTHTVRKKSYTFLIDKNLVYFLISDENMEKSERLGFLKTLRNVFGEKKKREELSSHCYQREFIPVFQQLLGPVLDQKMEQTMRNEEKTWRKMDSFYREFEYEQRNEEDDEQSRGFSLLKHNNGGLYSNELIRHRNAKKVWKKQVWIVLSLDLIICAVLFVVWLWVCRGFKCIHG